jgi:hypothetical protein
MNKNMFIDISVGSRVDLQCCVGKGRGVVQRRRVRETFKNSADPRLPCLYKLGQAEQFMNVCLYAGKGVA